MHYSHLRRWSKYFVTAHRTNIHNKHFNLETFHSNHVAQNQKWWRRLFICPILIATVTNAETKVEVFIWNNVKLLRCQDITYICLKFAGEYTQEPSHLKICGHVCVIFVNVSFLYCFNLRHTQFCLTVMGIWISARIVDCWHSRFANSLELPGGALPLGTLAPPYTPQFSTSLLCI